MAGDDDHVVCAITSLTAYYSLVFMNENMRDLLVFRGIFAFTNLVHTNGIW